MPLRHKKALPKLFIEAPRVAPPRVASPKHHTARLNTHRRAPPQVHLAIGDRDKHREPLRPRPDTSRDAGPLKGGWAPNPKRLGPQARPRPQRPRLRVAKVSGGHQPACSDLPAQPPPTTASRDPQRQRKPLSSSTVVITYERLTEARLKDRQLQRPFVVLLLPTERPPTLGPLWPLTSPKRRDGITLEPDGFIVMSYQNDAPDRRRRVRAPSNPLRRPNPATPNDRSVLTSPLSETGLFVKSLGPRLLRTVLFALQGREKVILGVLTYSLTINRDCPLLREALYYCYFN